MARSLSRGLGCVLGALQAGRIAPGGGLPSVENPIGVAALGGIATGGSTAVYLGGTVLIAVVIGALLIRGRRSGDLQERQQIKLLAYAAAVTIAALLLLTAISVAKVSIGNTLWNLPIMLGFGIAVPIACGLAILRHGLYEIDRLISRTISYLLVTGLLVGVFVGIVLLTTRVLPFSSPVGVAASTLAAAALFSPLRRRVQNLVDHRFNRTHYNADSVITAFSERLRGAIDPEAVQTGLLAAVTQAVAPAHASIWVRTPTQTPNN